MRAQFWGHTCEQLQDWIVRRYDFDVSGTNRAMGKATIDSDRVWGKWPMIKVCIHFRFYFELNLDKGCWFRLVVLRNTIVVVPIQDVWGSTCYIASHHGINQNRIEIAMSRVTIGLHFNPLKLHTFLLHPSVWRMVFCYLETFNSSSTGLTPLYSVQPVPWSSRRIQVSVDLWTPWVESCR